MLFSASFISSPLCLAGCFSLCRIMCANRCFKWPYGTIRYAVKRRLKLRCPRYVVLARNVFSFAVAGNITQMTLSHLSKKKKKGFLFPIPNSNSNFQTSRFGFFQVAA